MRMPPFSLHTPGSLDEALSIAGGLAEAGHEFDWVAGGTDLLPNYKWHLNSKPHVISLARISELSELTHTHIGAMVRLQDLVESDTVHPLITKVSGMVASVMLRRSGTVGGNICLDTRCFWFNQSEGGVSPLNGATSAIAGPGPTAESSQTRTRSASQPTKPTSPRC